MHQPTLGALVNERGISAGLLQAFARHQGPMWMLAGHGHQNADAVFALGQTTVVQAAMVTCGLDIWGGPDRPGYWIYCLRDGTVQGRVFRRHQKGYRTAPLPDRSKPRPVALPFAGLEGVLWRVFVGDGDREYLKSAKAADVVSWWGYLTEVVYAFPQTLFARPPAKLALLASLAHGHQDPERRGRVFVSSDGQTWQEAPLAAPVEGVYTVALPPQVAAAAAVYVKVTGPGYKGGATVAGFAFLGP